MNQKSAGIHHVTAIATDPQSNFDFYTSVLGLRFVKKTVNFDDPGTYHFYFGDELGRPAGPGGVGDSDCVATLAGVHERDPASARERRGAGEAPESGGDGAGPAAARREGDAVKPSGHAADAVEVSSFVTETKTTKSVACR